MAADSQNQNVELNLSRIFYNCNKNLYSFKTMHIFKSALHYIKYYKLALNTFQKGNAERYFFKVARLLQALIGNGT